MIFLIAVEIPFLVPSPSPSIAQSDATAPTIIEAPSAPNDRVITSFHLTVPSSPSLQL